MAVGGPPLSIQSLKTEFGVTGSRGLLDFRRNAGIVPDSPANSGVPTAAPIDLLDFPGATAQSISIANENIQAATISPADASATYVLNSSGLVQQILNGSTSTLGTWLLGGTAGAYEVFATV